MGDLRYFGKQGGKTDQARPSRVPDRIARPQHRAPSRVDVEGLPAIPDKIYFRIGEVSDLVGVEPHVLRYWEQEFRSVRPTKSQRGQRVYTRRDVEHLRKIRELLYDQKFTIPGARQALRVRGAEPREVNDPAIVASTRARQALLDVRAELVAWVDKLRNSSSK